MLRFALAIAVLCTCLFSSTAEAQILEKVLSPVKKCFGKNCQQQQSLASQAGTFTDYDGQTKFWTGSVVVPISSTGAAVVGQLDKDGAVITSVGPVVDPVPAMAPELPISLASEERSIAASSARDFRSALLKAARQERGGSITVGEYFQIFVGSLNAAKLEQAKLAVVDSAIQDGVLPADSAVGAIDWAKLIELIIKYLPMILDLFKGK